jgi:hypothetical protein
VIALYAVTDHPAPPLPAPLSAVSHQGIAFVCGAAPESAELSDELLWRHEELLEQLMEDRDLLPVRYGTVLPDEGAAARALLERHDELARALDRVRGAVELSVRVVATEDVPWALARRAVHQPLSLLARDSADRTRRAAGEVMRAAYLVDRSAVDRFVDRVTGIQSAHRELRLLCTGPWPAYSFSES